MSSDADLYDRAPRTSLNEAVSRLAQYLGTDAARAKAIELLMEGSSTALTERFVERFTGAWGKWTKLPPRSYVEGPRDVPVSFWLRGHRNQGCSTHYEGDEPGWEADWSTLTFARLDLIEEGVDDPVHPSTGYYRQTTLTGVSVELAPIEHLAAIYAQSSPAPGDMPVPIATAPGTIAAQRRCEEWLKQRLVGSDPTTVTVETIRVEALRLFDGLSGRAFDRAWGLISPEFGFGKGGRKRRA